MKDGVSLGRGILWVLVWFGFMLLYTALDVVVWRKLPGIYGEYLNLFSIIFCTIVFLVWLTKENSFKLNLSSNISFHGLILA